VRVQNLVSSSPRITAGRIRLHRLERLLQPVVLVTAACTGSLVVSLLPVVQDVPDRLLFPALVLSAVHSQADAFDQPLGLVAVQRDELVCPAGAHVRVERPRLLSVEFRRAQHVVLDQRDDARVDRWSLEQRR